MKTKEEIFNTHKTMVEGKWYFSGKEVLTYGNAIKAMDEHADQQTEQLKKQLEEKEKEHKEHVEKLCRNIRILEERVKDGDKELFKLKLTYKDDIKDAYDAGFEHVGDVMMGSEKRTSEQYYIQTHGQ